ARNISRTASNFSRLSFVGFSVRRYSSASDRAENLHRFQLTHRDLEGGIVSRRIKQAIVVLVVVFAAAQLVRPDRTNPPTDASRTFQAHGGTSGGLAAILDRSCRDCHSNETEWAWYTQIAPLSWLMARSVTEGRKAVNFSEWAAYTPQQRRLLLSASCDDARSGKMPGPYTFFKSETRLTADEIETICTAARQADAR